MVNARGKASRKIERTEEPRDLHEHGKYESIEDTVDRMRQAVERYGLSLKSGRSPRKHLSREELEAKERAAAVADERNEASRARRERRAGRGSRDDEYYDNHPRSRRAGGDEEGEEFLEDAPGDTVVEVEVEVVELTDAERALLGDDYESLSEQEKSARRIQAGVKGRVSRKKVAMSMEEARLQGLHHSASVVQGAMRGRDVRDQMGGYIADGMNDSARAIQASMRGRQDREDMRAMHADLDDAAGVVQGGMRGRRARGQAAQMYEDEMHESAGVIQGSMRGRRQRDEMDQVWADRDEAARTVQGGLRGRDGRGAVAGMHQGREDAAASVQGAMRGRRTRDGVNAELELQDQAAGAIQSGYRMKRDRKFASARAREREAELAGLSKEEQKELKRKRFPADVAEWRAAVDRHMVRYMKQRDIALDAVSPVLPQGSGEPASPEALSAEDATDLCRSAFDHLAEQSGAVDLWDAPVLGAAEVASVILALCQESGQDFGMLDDEELTQRVVRDVQIFLKEGGHGIQVDAQHFGDEGERVTFSGLMLLLTRHPWKPLLSSPTRKRIPSVLVGDMRLNIVGTAPAGQGDELEAL